MEFHAQFTARGGIAKGAGKTSSKDEKDRINVTLEPGCVVLPLRFPLQAARSGDGFLCSPNGQYFVFSWYNSRKVPFLLSF